MVTKTVQLTNLVTGDIGAIAVEAKVGNGQNALVWQMKKVVRINGMNGEPRHEHRSGAPNLIVQSYRIRFNLMFIFMRQKQNRTYRKRRPTREHAMDSTASSGSRPQREPMGAVQGCKTGATIRIIITLTENVKLEFTQ